MLGARVATALILLCIFSAALFGLPAPGWGLAIAVAVAIAGWEWAGLSGMTSRNCKSYGVATGIVAWLLAGASQAGSADSLLAATFASAALFWILVAPLWLWKKWQLHNRLAAALVGWLVLLPPAAAMVELRAASPLVLLAAMALVWVADIAAYFAGRTWGRRKLAPLISPGKTWEGVAGALLAVLVGGALGLATVPEGLLAPGATIWLGLGLVPLTGVGIVGDLFESLVKRQAGMKDSSHLLPGHGGLLDRIDSLCATLPCVGLAVLWFQR